MNSAANLALTEVNFFFLRGSECAPACAATPSRRMLCEMSKNLEVRFFQPRYDLLIRNARATFEDAAKHQLKLKGRIMKNAKKCPVCDWDINDAGIKVKVGGKEITVCCDDCAKKVEETPAKYGDKTE